MLKTFNWEDPSSNTIEVIKKEAEIMGIQLPSRLRKQQMLQYVINHKQSEKKRLVTEAKSAKNQRATSPCTNIIFQPEKVIFYSSSLLSASKQAEVPKSNESISRRSPTPSFKPNLTTSRNKILYAVIFTFICIVAFPPLLPIAFILFLSFWIYSSSAKPKL